MKVKEQKTQDIISVAEYAEGKFNRRGFPVSVSYIYRLIREYKAGIRHNLPFEFKEIGQSIFIIKK